MPETIVAAAIKNGDLVSFVPRPGRHHDVIAGMDKAKMKWPIAGEQGFVTSTGRFVGRGEARQIADAAGQLIASDAGPDGVPFVRQHKHLFSEDVW